MGVSESVAVSILFGCGHHGKRFFVKSVAFSGLCLWASSVRSGSQWNPKRIGGPSQGNILELSEGLVPLCLRAEEWYGRFRLLIIG